MSRPLSIYLDLVRFGAAFVVLLSHLAYSRFTGGSYSFLREYNQGSDAVVLFFVLSGLVIAYTTDAKRSGASGDMSRYLVSRFSRLYSVVLPAIVLGLLLDAWGNAIDQRAYDGWWHAGDRPVWRAITSLLFAIPSAVCSTQFTPLSTDLYTPFEVEAQRVSRSTGFRAIS